MSRLRLATVCAPPPQVSVPPPLVSALPFFYLSGFSSDFLAVKSKMVYFKEYIKTSHFLCSPKCLPPPLIVHAPLNAYPHAPQCLFPLLSNSGVLSLIFLL